MFSRHALLREVQRALAAALVDATVLGDWMRHALDRSDEGAQTDNDDLFVHYRSFARSVGAAPEDILRYARFNQALSAQGIAATRLRSGHVIRHGCRLIDDQIDRPISDLITLEQAPATAPCDSADDLGRFLRDLCEVSEDLRNVRAPSQLLHKLYKAWAAATGAAGCSSSAFRKAMESKGFERLTSDGVKWQGVRIRDGVSLDDVERGHWPPRPEAFDGNSGADDPGSIAPLVGRGATTLCKGRS